jgi:hypothetical protein
VVPTRTFTRALSARPPHRARILILFIGDVMMDVRKKSEAMSWKINGSSLTTLTYYSYSTATSMLRHAGALSL